MDTAHPTWPNGPSDMAARIGAHDWAATPLGATAQWPPHLKGVVDTVVSAAHPMMLAWGPALTMVYNDGYAACLGGRHPAALGRSLPDMWPDVWPQIGPMTGRVFAGEAVQCRDMRLVLTRNGHPEESWWTFSLSPVWDAAHAVAGMLVVTTAQVLERRDREQVRARLRESEARHLILIGSWAQAVWETDADGVVVTDSPSWRAYTGQTLDEWLGYGWLDAIHPDDRDHAGRQWREAVAAGGPVDAELRLRAPDGGWRWTNVRAAPVPDAAGRIGKWAGINIDIDARKRTETALRESESRLAAAFEAVPAGVAVIDRDGRQIIGNLAYRGFLMSDTIPSRDPAARRHWQAWDGEGRLIDPADYPGARALRGEHVVPGMEMLRTGDDGTAIWVDVAAVPTFDAAGRVNGCICVLSDITGRKRAEGMLRDAGERQRIDLEKQVQDRTAERQASQELLQALLDASTDMIQVFEAVRDAAGEIVDFRWVLNNHTSERLHGKVHGESLLQRNPGVVQEGIFDTFRRVIETGIPEDAERHYVHEQFDGWFHQSVVRLGDGVATTTRDISDWKAAQADVLRLLEDVAQGRLRESEERFRLLVESVRDHAIFTIDMDGLITSWPAGAASVYGWSERDILGQPVDLTFVPEDVASGQPQQERDTALRAGVAPNVRWHLRQDGTRIFIDGSTQPLTGMDGKVREFIMIGQDVTEARRVQQALAESEGRLRTLTEGMPQLVWRSADRGQWTWSSPQWQSFTGLDAAASIGLGWIDAVHPDDRAATMTAWANAADAGTIDVEYRVRRAADGEYVWHHTRALPVRGGDGGIVEWLGTTTDVQQLKELQERQALLVAELQHRTRNLMAVVRSMADKTARASADLPDFRSRFRDRLDALARVQGLLSRLNDHDRVTFDEIVQAELNALEGSADRVSTDGPAGIRLRSSTVQIMAMALHELATNALKYGALSQPGGRLAITWSLAPGGEDGQPWLHIDWRERGVTMPACPSPHGTGQGRELIERALPYQLGARTSYTLGTDGVHCTIAAPASASNAETDHG